MGSLGIPELLHTYLGVGVSFGGMFTLDFFWGLFFGMVSVVQVLTSVASEASVSNCVCISGSDMSSNVIGRSCMLDIMPVARTSQVYIMISVKAHVF